MCAKPAAQWLRTQPRLMWLATAATPLLEQYIAPALLLCPVRHRVIVSRRKGGTSTIGSGPRVNLASAIGAPCQVRRWQPAARLLALGLLLGLQLTFLATMVLGNFPFIATAAVANPYPNPNSNPNPNPNPNPNQP